MRFTTLWLDGYGRFTGHVIQLQPGLQVILGPNEQGKSTIRNFLTDMLYGQRRGPQFRTFEDANELRRPWNGGERYAGRLHYVLDDGREFEVQRNFDRKRGTVALFDRKHMRDITAEFGRPKNREPNFGEEHLGLSKTVFVNTATIGPMSLDDLGDDDAMAQIREKILSLADTSDESGTAEGALRILTDRIAEIGRPVSHSKKPLPLAKAKLDKLDQELARARLVANEIGALEAQWKSVTEKRAAARRNKEELEKEWAMIERHDRSQRLIEAQRLQTRIDEVTQTCFLHSAVREFPLEQTPEVQRAANAAATARAQADRTLAELEELERQLAEESAALEADGVPQIAEVPESTEQELSSLDGKIVRLRERLEEAEGELAKARARHAQAQQDLQSLPDFSRLGADPLAWLSQLATSFRVARQSRNLAEEKLKRLREEIARRRAARGASEKFFEEFVDFPAESREFEVQSRLTGERLLHLRSEIESLRIETDEQQESGPYALWTAAILGGVACACAGAALWLQLPYVYLPAVGSAIAAAMSVARWSWSRKALRKAEDELLRTQEELSRVEREHAARGARFDSAKSRVGVSSLRELEAVYERLVREETELSALTQSELQLTREAEEARDRVEHLFEKLRETFHSAGEHVDHEEDIDTAAARTMSRYQEYRDAKRRLGESRDRQAQLQVQLASLQAELDECQRLEINLALAVRHTLREAGFREEARYTNVLAALQAFHVRTAQVREKIGRVAVMRERLQTLRTRLDAERRDMAKQDEALARRLRAGGADSIEQWYERAKKAKLYRDARDERARLEERLEATLRGETIEAMRARVEAEGPGLGLLSRNTQEVKLDLQKNAALLESLANEERDLQIALTQRTAGQRTLNEIEEEREEAAARVAELELELEATTYAATLIEEAARDRHARIAPRIAEVAGQYLGRITGGAYNEIMVSRELKITVRIPQTARLSEDPKRLLSKGTVDQVYLALRLALVQAMSANGESVPLLLDDPFANYDDSRLANALRLLTEIGNSHQILLFTCRQDVARAARDERVPILEI